MMLQQLSDDVVPLSKRHQITLWLIVACVFQFLLFFSPVLAAEAVAQEELANQSMDTQVSLSQISKSARPVSLVYDFMHQQGVLGEPNYLENDQELEPELKMSIKTEPNIRVVRTSTHVMTAYNSLPEQTDSQPCITANGFNVCKHGIEDTIAANFLPFGTMVRIPDLFGDRIFIVRDRMNKRYSDRVDIWMLEKPTAIQFGVKRARIEVVEYLN